MIDKYLIIGYNLYRYSVKENGVMRRKRMKAQKRIVIISALSLLLCFSIAYAAFNTTITLRAKGNIKKVTAASQLRKLVNNKSGDGLFADTYESGRYFFKGEDPNNYITFNGEEWRILSVEYDDTIKIVKNAVLEDSLPWNTEKNLDWGKSTLNKYLNETYFNSLLDMDSVMEHNFAAGAVTLNSNYMNLGLNEQIISENGNYVNGKIGLLTASEYLRANTNSDECGSLYLNNVNYEKCRVSNYLNQISMPNYTMLWTMTPIINNTNETNGVNSINEPDSTNDSADVNEDVKDTNNVVDNNSVNSTSNNAENLLLDSQYNYAFGISVPWLESNFVEQKVPVGKVTATNIEMEYGVVPTLYLKSDVVLEGNGTKDDPYYIEK